MPVHLSEALTERAQKQHKQIEAQIKINSALTNNPTVT